MVAKINLPVERFENQGNFELEREKSAVKISRYIKKVGKNGKKPYELNRINSQSLNDKTDLDRRSSINKLLR